jgi:hypothetical protein
MYKPMLWSSPTHNALEFSCTHMGPGSSKIQTFACCTRETYMSTTTLCAATTRHSAARDPRQPCRAPRLLVTRPHGLYLNCAARRNYSSPGRTGSTSTTPCATTTRLPVAQALPQPCQAPSCRLTSRRSVALTLIVRLVTASRGATTRRPDCTSSTAPMLCIRMPRLGARLLFDRSH